MTRYLVPLWISIPLVALALLAVLSEVFDHGSTTVPECLAIAEANRELELARKELAAARAALEESLASGAGSSSGAP